MSDIDHAAIRTAALEYVESWYAGDGDRVEAVVHPDLAKRIVERDALGRDRLEHMGALELVQNTRRGSGRKVGEARRQRDVQVLDGYGNAAAVKVVAADWVDYLHLARLDGQWRIVNVLWTMKSPAEPQPAPTA